MKNLLFLVLFAFLSILSAQIPIDGDSIYYSAKYCNTAETIEDCTNSWIWNVNVGDCIQPSQLFCEGTFPGVWILDTYECCCKVASTPGMESSWTGFDGSLCESYLYDVGFLLVIENELNPFDGIYVDIFGREYTTQPKGLSIKNRRTYYKIK